MSGYYNCTLCGEDELLLDEMQWSPSMQERQKRPYWCKPCYREYYRERQAEKRARRPHHAKARRYGTTEGVIEALLATPCDICGKEAEVIDHCHDTGDVRGGLCQACNKILGFAKDQPAVLRRAAAYLEGF